MVILFIGDRNRMTRTNPFTWSKSLTNLFIEYTSPLEKIQLATVTV